MEENYVEREASTGEKATEWLIDHPVIACCAYFAAGLAVTIPILTMFGKCVGKAAGKEMAKQLLKTGTQLA